jgi:hypothetical protein
MHIITSAISGMPVNMGLWENLKELSKILGARIMVIGNYAENPNMADSQTDAVFWTPLSSEIELHIVRDQVIDLGGAVVRSDWNIRPKTLNPLTIARGASKGTGHQIFAHPQIAVESQPRAINAPSKSLYTTGTITIQDCQYYRRSQSERAAQFHHTYGFLVVCGSHVFPVSATRDGSFTFFNHTFGSGAAPQRWAQLGDIHFPNHDPMLLAQVIDLLGGLEVSDIILHDTLDFQYGSHHQYSHRTKDKAAHLNSVTAELKRVADLINWEFDEFNLHIIQSNHDQHLDRWLAQDASKIHHADLRLYFNLNYRLLTHDKSAFELAMGDRLKDARFYNDFQPMVTQDILHLHGDRGNAGSRGTPTQFAKSATKICAGHTHSESILKGYYNPGCLKRLPSDYEGGLTSTTQGLVLISGNGKRQLVTARDGVLIPPEILEALA